MGSTNTREYVTGAIRFRRGLLGRPVLQIELMQETIPWAPPPPGEDAKVLRRETYWRDASRPEVDGVMRSPRYEPGGM